MTNLFTETALRTGNTLLKIGFVFLISNLASSALKETAQDGMSTLAKDVRKIKSEYQDRNMQNVS